jgi:nicotinate phosphoribosyltransferase
VGIALRTDLYELNMAASYLRRGMTAPATFSLFIREAPSGWGFLVACGLERCLEYLDDLRFADEDLTYLRDELGFDAESLEAFGELRFTGEVRAIPEGRMVLPEEPLLEVTAPLPEAQLLESYLLNQITFQTVIASKAARCRLANPDASLVDFAFRRVHGVEAGIAAARATAITGFTATSNVEAARVLGLRAAGTMAHSYIEAFPSEIEAFRAFARDFPGRVTLLVDTYDTPRGVAKAIEVAQELRAQGRGLEAIRLDSGDLGALAKEARGMLDQADLSEVRILASGGIDEHAIAALTAEGAPIDAYGVGTKVGVSADAPFLDSVYKLVAYDGRPVAKLSTGKATLPGEKQVWRRPGMRDVVGLREEPGPGDGEPLLQPVVEDGARLDHGGWPEARERFQADLAALPDELRGLRASAPVVERSDRLLRVDREVREEIARRELG